MEPFERALFGCCHSGRILSDDYGISTYRSNDVTRSAEHWAYPSSKSLKTDANSCTDRRECLPFKITWAQISSRDAIFIFSLHAGAVVWPLLPDRDTFRRCFDLGFHDQGWGAVSDLSLILDLSQKFKHGLLRLKSKLKLNQKQHLTPDGRVKIDHCQKRTCADMRLSKYIMEPVHISKPWFV